MKRILVHACFYIVCGAALSVAQLRSFSIRYINNDVVYLQGGSAAGLKEGMRLTVKRPGAGESPLLAPSVAEIVVISVASTSAACEIVREEVSIRVGDQAFISSQDLEKQDPTSSETQTFAQIIEFTGVDPIEEELRENIPRPPLGEENRLSGRVGFELDSIFDRSGAGLHSHQQGVVFRFDYTRIGNSHWNLGGYWRGRINSTKRPREQESINDVLQRVYHFGLRYDNPQSSYAIGLGRVLVPWAPSLNTLDGGYFGVKVGKSTTVGAFGGTTPDPTAWNYDPDRQLVGAFVSIDRGSFEKTRYAVTTGLAVSRLDWKSERQFMFVETGVLMGSKVSFHHNIEVDYQSADRFASSSPIAVTRSFATVRVQPVPRLSLDLSHNYFRVLPTFDERLIVTQALDNLLYRGFNGGARVELAHGIAVYGSGGQSSRTGDASGSWNGMGGVSARIPKTGFRADARYSRFNAAIGSGSYRSISFRRDSSDRWHFQLEGGDQHFETFFTDSTTWYGMGTVDIFVGRFVLGFRGTLYRGTFQSYDQLQGSLDFRF